LRGDLSAAKQWSNPPAESEEVDNAGGTEVGLADRFDTPEVRRLASAATGALAVHEAIIHMRSLLSADDLHLFIDVPVVHPELRLPMTSYQPDGIHCRSFFYEGICDGVAIFIEPPRRPAPGHASQRKPVGILELDPWPDWPDKGPL
jgi:hypothetical protein